MKRFLDINISIALMLMIFPLMLITAFLVYVKLGRPILFIQERPGKGGRTFRLLKFRSMETICNPTDGKTQTDKDRLTSFGRLIRSTSIDELPSLVNVIKGDMSLVGPRPLLVEYLPLYSPFQARRHEVRPGITGWAQVNGRNALTWQEKFALDVWYVDNRSFKLDIKIIWMTLHKVVRREGISSKGEVTMHKFIGNTLGSE